VHKVLIVDDEPVYCKLLSRLLERKGCSTRVADGAHQAIDIASDFRPDVIVADWMLRDFHDGLDLLYALRQASIHAPLILISGYPSDQLRLDARSSGVFRFLSKPFEPDDLLAAIFEAVASVGKGPAEAAPAPLAGDPMSDRSPNPLPPAAP